MSKLQVSIVPVGLGCVMVALAGVALAAPPRMKVPSALATPAKSVANCCHDRLTGSLAKRGAVTPAQCARQIADVDQGGGPEAAEPVAAGARQQAANTAKPGR